MVAEMLILLLDGETWWFTGSDKQGLESGVLTLAIRLHNPGSLFPA